MNNNRNLKTTTVFDDLASGANRQDYVPRSLEAQEYYRRKARSLRTLTPQQLIRSGDTDRVFSRVPNKRDVIGPGEYRQAFIELLNQRMADYAEFGYSEDEGPSFGMKRFFGDQVKPCFQGEDQKWASSQVMDIEVPEIMTHLKRATPNLFM